MARRSRAARETPAPIENGEDRIDGFAPPDRADQITAGSGEAEEIDIFAKRNDGEDHPPPRQQSAGDDDEDRAPPVESREHRSRDEDDEPRLQRRERTSRRGDDERYSRNVQRRINREYALRVRAETRLKEERAARLQLEQRLQKLERANIESQSKASLREIEAQIREVTQQLAEAKENSETAREVELQVKLGELQAEKIKLQNRIEQETRELETREQQRQQDADADEDAPRGRSADWVRAQRRWWNTTRWKDARQDAIAHDTTILEEIKEGVLDFEPYSDEHMAELSRRLKEDYPDLEIRTIEGELFELDDEQEGDDDYRRSDMGNRRDDDYDDDDYEQRRPAPRQRRAPMNGLGGRDGRRQRNAVELARQGKVTLTEEDFNTMRIFKLDPNNPEHKKAFARERARTLLRDANGATRR